MVLIEEITEEQPTRAPPQAPRAPPSSDGTQSGYDSAEDWVHVGGGDAAAAGAAAGAAPPGGGDVAAAPAPAAEAAPPPVEEEEDPEVVAEKLARAEATKAEANALFAAGDTEAAAALYTRALGEAPRGAPGAAARAVLHANRAACHARRGRHAAVVADCTDALAARPDYAKALLRRAAAAEALGDVEAALADAEAVLALDPANRPAAAARARLEPAVAEKREALKAEMIGKLKELGNMVLGNFGMSCDNFKLEQDPATGGYSIKMQR